MKISDNKIVLKELTERDVYGEWWQWFNDPIVTAHMNKGESVNTPDLQMEFFHKVQASDSDYILGIFDIESGRHIGTTGLHNIREEDCGRVGNFGIIIGDKKFWGQGIGTQAWQLMMRYGFDTLSLDCIETKIFVSNKASMRVAEKIGFLVKKNESGVMKDGKPVDRTILRLSKVQWESTQTLSKKALT